MPDELISVLGEGSPLAPRAAGGKAAALDRLIRLGEPVPPGYCVTAAAYRAHLRDHGLLEDFARLTAGGVNEDARRELVAMVDALPLSPRVAAALAAGLDRLRSPRLAVRSSASDEDGALASFAGVHDSFLDVHPDGLEDAVRGCWRSLWSERAIAYRRRRGLGLCAEMGVIVMAMVPVVAAAVAFSRHPVLGTDDVLVSCAAGLGDALMAGGGSAVSYEIERDTGAVLDVDADQDADPLPLGEADICNLARRIVALEHAFGLPLDVEAVHDGERWLLVQARPITTGCPRQRYTTERA